jgi:hypothetical protein
MASDKFIASEYKRLFSEIEKLYHTLDPINDKELTELLHYIQQRWQLDRDFTTQIDHIVGVLVRIATERRVNYDPNV